MLASESSDSALVQSAKRKRLYQFLVMLFLALFIVGANMPILDYTKRESLAYIKEPSPQNLDALHAKQKEQRRKQWIYASPLALLGIFAAIPLLTKYRRRT